MAGMIGITGVRSLGNVGAVNSQSLGVARVLVLRSRLATIVAR
ncbi:MAG: hypothetical protein WD533_09150 [Dehalococcoidia bacterium]